MPVRARAVCQFVSVSDLGVTLMAEQVATLLLKQLSMQKLCCIDLLDNREWKPGARQCARPARGLVYAPEHWRGGAVRARDDLSSYLRKVRVLPATVIGESAG